VKDPFAVVADPTRRRILELLAGGERSAGDVTAAIQAEAGVSQSAVSQHLGALKDAGFVAVRVDAQRRMYRTDPAPLNLIAVWLDHVTPAFEQQLDALATEVSRGKRERRRAIEGQGTGQAGDARLA
jgi:DNA-binding transcriptional ArsR family regulator